MSPIGRGQPGARAAAAATAIVLGLIAGCSGGGTPSGSTEEPARSPAAATSTVVPEATPPTPEASSAGPPPAWLTLLDGRSIAGEPGSWTLDGVGSEVPWWPASALESVRVTAGGTITVELHDRLRIGTWRADVAPAADPTGAATRWLAGLETVAPPAQRIQFTAPAAGSWVLRVTLGFAGGRGDASYSWSLEVREP